MSIDNIQLPISLYQSLFKKSLVDLQTKFNRNGIHKKEAGIDFLGGNEKNIVFVVKNGQHKFLNDSELKFLSGLIEACSITMGDIAIINFASHKDVTYKNLLSLLAPQRILCFGISSADIGLPFKIPYFQIQHFEETQYIFCPGLEQLQEDVDSKKQLWISLQKIFKINK